LGYILIFSAQLSSRRNNSFFYFPLGRWVCYYSVFIPAHQANLADVTSSIGAKADYAVCLFSASW